MILELKETTIFSKKKKKKPQKFSCDFYGLII